MAMPEIRKDEKRIYTLYVEGKPFFLYSGELHNSSTSDLKYMEEKVWPRLAGLHMNSVIAPVAWEMIEETEGKFCFDIVDGLIGQARKYGMKLILIWFGLWKNAESMYVPEWMKKNTDAYFRAEKVSGEKLPTISPFCEAAVEKDAFAFAALMEHLREFDGEEHTAVVIQVENEIGILGSARDYCDAANEKFEEEIPAVLTENLNVGGTWKEAFGDEAEEAFMAWHFACAVEKITSAGRDRYPLPCYANSWLKQYPWYPGSYPMGGPVPSVHKIWKLAAPSLFTFGPDIYVPYCADVMDEYGTAENPLFIPEIRRDAVAVSYCMYAFGAKNAVCFSPFGIEDLSPDAVEAEMPPADVMAALNIDPSAFNITGSYQLLAETYRLMKELEPFYLKHRGTEHLKSFVRHGENDYGTFLQFKKYDVQAAYAPRQSGKPLGAGIFMELDEDTFLLAGTMCTVSFMAKPGENCKVDILRMEEGILEQGEWTPGRILNGDEKMTIRFGETPSLLKIKLYKF